MLHSSEANPCISHDDKLLDQAISMIVQEPMKSVSSSTRNRIYLHSTANGMNAVSPSDLVANRRHA